MKRAITILILTLCWASLAIADFPIPEFEANYSVSRNGMVFGESKRQLDTLPNKRHIFTSETRSVGFASLFIKDKVIEQSFWKFNGEQSRIRPDTYIYARTGGRKERHVKLNFDHENNKVVNTINNDPWSMKIPEDALDKYNYQLQIMIDLENNIKKLSYNIADGGRLKNYEFKVLGEERIRTKMGFIEALKLKRVNDKRNTTLWCAKEYHYLPVKIEQEEDDGTTYTATIKELDGM